VKKKTEPKRDESKRFAEKRLGRKLRRESIAVGDVARAEGFMREKKKRQADKGRWRGTSSGVRIPLRGVKE